MRRIDDVDLRLSSGHLSEAILYGTAITNIDI